MYRALLVGAGGMGRAWARNLVASHHRVQICGWVDVVAGKAREALLELDSVAVDSVPDFVNLENALAVTKARFCG